MIRLIKMSYLQASQQAQFDSNGRAVVILAPIIYGINWEVRRMIISTTSDSRAECRVYRGGESMLNMVDGSRSANQDVSDSHISISSPEKLMFVFEGGTPNAIATARVEGEQTTRRFR